MDFLEKCLLEDLHTSESNVRQIVQNMEKRFPEDESKPMIPAWNFWKQAYEAAATARTEPEIVAAATDAMGTEHEYIQPEWIVVQSLMKATVHMYWRRLMELHCGWDLPTLSYKTPDMAVKIALGTTTYKLEAQQLFRKVFAHVRPDIIRV